MTARRILILFNRLLLSVSISIHRVASAVTGDNWRNQMLCGLSFDFFRQKCHLNYHIFIKDLYLYLSVCRWAPFLISRVFYWSSHCLQKPWSSNSNEQPISNERNVLDLHAVFATQCSLYWVDFVLVRWSVRRHHESSSMGSSSRAVLQAHGLCSSDRTGRGV